MDWMTIRFKISGIYSRLSHIDSKALVGLSRYSGLDIRGSIPDLGQGFLLPVASRPVLGPAQSPTKWVLVVISPEVKRPGRAADHCHLVRKSRIMEL
jgi:hypothetical protein